MPRRATVLMPGLGVEVAGGVPGFVDGGDDRLQVDVVGSGHGDQLVVAVDLDVGDAGDLGDLLLDGCLAVAAGHALNGEVRLDAHGIAPWVARAPARAAERP